MFPNHNRNASEIVLGLCRVYVGDPTQENGLYDLGRTGGAVTFSPNEQVTPITGYGDGAPFAAYSKGFAPTVTAPLLQRSIEILRRTFAAAEVSGRALAGKNLYGGRRVQPQTLVLVPEAEAELGATAPNAIWIWAAVPTNPGQLTFEEPTENPTAREVEFQGLVDETRGGLVFSIGDPAEIGVAVHESLYPAESGDGGQG